MAYRLPPPWDPGYALPSNVRDEGLQRQAFVTKWTPRGTYDNVSVGAAGYVVPQYVMDEGTGQGAYTTDWLPDGTYSGPKVPHWLNQRPTVQQRSLGKGARAVTVTRQQRQPSLGVQAQTAAAMSGTDASGPVPDGSQLPEMFETFGHQAASHILSSVARIAPKQRKAVLQKVLHGIDPSLWNRTAAITKRHLAAGASPQQALHAGLSRALGAGMAAEMIQVGKTKKIKPRSLLGLAAFGSDAVMGALGMAPSRAGRQALGAVGLAASGTAATKIPTTTAPGVVVGGEATTGNLVVTLAEGNCSSNDLILKGGAWVIRQPTDVCTAQVPIIATPANPQPGWIMVGGANGQGGMYFDPTKGPYIAMYMNPTQVPTDIFQVMRNQAQTNIPAVNANGYQPTMADPMNLGVTSDQLVAAASSFCSGGCPDIPVAYAPVLYGGYPMMSVTYGATPNSAPPGATLNYTSFLDWVFALAGVMPGSPYNPGPLSGAGNFNTTAPGNLEYIGGNTVIGSYGGMPAMQRLWDQMGEVTFDPSKQPPFAGFTNPSDGTPWGIWVWIVNDHDDTVKGAGPWPDGVWNSGTDMPNGFHLEVGFHPIVNTSWIETAIKDVTLSILWLPAQILVGATQVVATVIDTIAQMACSSVAGKSNQQVAQQGASVGGAYGAAGGVATKALCGGSSTMTCPAGFVPDSTNTTCIPAPVNYTEYILIGGAALLAILLLTGPKKAAAVAAPAAATRVTRTTRSTSR